MSAEPIGLCVIDKPAGITSHDVVARLRRALGVRRVGHAGTLDPPATGVLLVGVGRATRLLEYLQGTDKTYEGTLALGRTTTTLDATGEVTATFSMRDVTAEQVATAALALTGTIAQVPPMVSAISIAGRRLHSLARQGIEVDRAAREVTVLRFDVAPVPGDPLTYRFVVECSSGTYVRSLVDDLGTALGGGAHLVALRRTRVGRFSIDDAVALEAVERDGAGAVLRASREMVGHLDAVVVDAAGRDDVAHGRRIVAAPPRARGTAVAVLDADGELCAVGVDDGAGSLSPAVVLIDGA